MKNNLVLKLTGILAVLVFSAAALSGCGGASQPATENLLNSTDNTAQSTEYPESLGEITLEEAKAIAFENLGVTEEQVTLTKTETRATVYDIEFIYDGYEYDMEIEKATGIVVKYEKDAVKQGGDNSSADIGIEEAKNIALAYVGASLEEANIYKAELDNRVYEIEFIYDGSKHDVEVSKSSGEVVNYKKEVYSGGNNNQTGTQNGEQSGSQNTPSASDISLEEAKNIALNYAGVSESESVIYEAHLDNGVYEIEFYAGDYEYEVKVSKATGEVVKFDKDYCHHQDHHHSSSGIDYSQALSIAYSHAGVTEDSVYDMEIELDNGRYEIEFKSNGYEYEYEISADDGTVIKWEKDR